VILKYKRPFILLCAGLLLGIPNVVRLLPNASAQAVLDIRSFGARCNGSDDTGAVQAALNAIPVGGTLVFSCQAGITQVSLSNRSNITIAGSNGGGVTLLTQTGDNWSRAFALNRCSSCTVRDMVFEGNFKDMIPFNIEDSTSSTVSGLTIRNVSHAGAAFLAVHNHGNRYLNNTLQTVGMELNPGQYDSARGMWVGGVSDATKETAVTISGNKFIDISGSALAVHGSGMTITGNTGVRLNWACIKVLPLGGSGSTLIADNNCSGAGAKWLIGGGIMTEYYNSAYENSVIRNNVLEGYATGDVSRVPDSPSVGINVANPPNKVSHNVQILNNTIRNMLYDSIQISGPTDNFVIEGNILERTISNGTQWNGINLQGDNGKVITNGVIRRNIIRGKFDGIRMGGGGGTINGVTLDGNSVVSMNRDGLHIEVDNGGQVNGLSVNANCFSSIGNKTIWDNRSNPLQPVPTSANCSDPSAAVSIMSPAAGQTVSGVVTLQASASGSVGVQFKIDGAPHSAELLSLPYTLMWDSRTVSNGTRQIVAEGRDAAGNRVSSAPVTVTVSNPVPDSTAPTVSVTSPANGATVSGTLNLTANAGDNVGVTGLQFLLNGSALGAKKTSAPYTMSWDSKSVADGNYQLSAVAEDAAGNKSSSMISIVVGNADKTAPTVSVTSPGNGATVSGTLNLTATANDNVGVAGVQFLLNGSALGAKKTSAPYTMSWDSKSVSDGNYQLSAVAEDAAGNKNSSVISIVVGNADKTLPTVSITSPANGATVSGTLNLTAAASDNVGVTGLQFLLNGSALGAKKTSAPYTMSWDSKSVSDGNYQLSAVAEDAAGNKKTAVISLVVGNADKTAPTVSITSPANGATVSGSLNLTAAAADNVGVAGLQFLINGAPYSAEDTAAPYAVTWNTASVANGSYQISAVARDSAGNRTTSPAVSVMVSNGSVQAPAALTAIARINAGGGAYTDPQGNTWAADYGFNGGYQWDPALPVSGTNAPNLYKSQHWHDGVLIYTIPVPNGSYMVNLKWAELYCTRVGERVFNININGQRALSNFDILAAAGGFGKPVDRSFPITVTGGKIVIEFASTVENPTISAIEILKSTTPAPPAKTVIRVNAGGSTYTDASGNTWSADTGSSGGYLFSTGASIANTSTPEIYKTVRWADGTLGYQFNVPNGTYTVNLKFAEVYWTKANERLFHIILNGQTVLQNFDVLAQAGGPNRAIDKAFTVNVTNGSLSIQLKSTADNPMISAIEIMN
jgi:hypothetical protein